MKLNIEKIFREKDEGVSLKKYTTELSSHGRMRKYVPGRTSQAYGVGERMMAGQTQPGGAHCEQRTERQQRADPTRGSVAPRVLPFTLTSLGNISSKIQSNVLQDDFSAAVQTEGMDGRGGGTWDARRSMRRWGRTQEKVTRPGMATVQW